MAIEGNLEYALARVEAGHARHLQEADWRRLETSRDLAHYLEAVRGTALTGWIASLNSQHGSHEIERSLRAQWRGYVDAVASWHSHKWQKWLRWLAWLPSLSLLAQLARPEPAPRWMLEDPLFGPIASRAPTERAAAMKSTPLAPLEAGLRGEASLPSLWRRHWQLLFPPTAEGTRSLFDRLMKHLDQHARALESDQTKASRLRRDLHGHLSRLFRAGAGTAMASACHLGMSALELERLRGGLAARCALPARSAGRPR